MNTLMRPKAWLVLCTFLAFSLHSVGYALDALPFGSLAKVRDYQLTSTNAQPNRLKIELYKEPYHAQDLLVSSNFPVSFIGWSSNAVASEILRVAFEMAKVATTYPNPTNRFLVYLSAIRESSVSNTTYSSETLVSGGTYLLSTNGSGGYVVPDMSGLELIFGNHLLIHRDVKFFHDFEFFGIKIDNRAAVKISIKDNNGVVIREVVDNPRGNEVYRVQDNMIAGSELAVYSYAGMMAIKLSLITNATLGEVTLEYPGGIMRRFRLDTGAQIVSPIGMQFWMSNGNARFDNLSGESNEQLLIETATSLQSNAVWTVLADLALPQSNGTSFIDSASPPGGQARFYRLRYK